MVELVFALICSTLLLVIGMYLTRLKPYEIERAKYQGARENAEIIKKLKSSLIALITIAKLP